MWAGEARVRHMFKWMSVSTDKQVHRWFALPARWRGGFRTICASFLGSYVGAGRRPWARCRLRAGSKNACDEVSSCALRSYSAEGENGVYSRGTYDV
jgi:hypothetical protein